MRSILRATDAIATAAAAVAIAAAAVAALVGPGYRIGWIGLGTAFRTLGYGAATAAVAALIAVAAGLPGAIARRSAVRIAICVVVLAIGASAAYVPYAYRQGSLTAPPIHDISTDTADPPSFVAVVPLRAAARNPVAYGGAAVASQQRAAYPDLQPVDLPVPPADAHRRALDAVEKLGWQLVASDPAQGRIEATDTTFWFGFKDDIVIRIAGSGGGSRVDVRSLSRIGVSDLGTNARRVRRFIALLRDS